MDISTKEHLEKLLDAEIRRLEQQFRERFRGMDEALKLQRSELQQRFHQINDLRREVTEDRINFANKDVTKVIAFVYAIALLIVGVIAAMK